ncbi:MAG: ABC transporter permease [Deltaproteobacteria bacterium]|nr:ABC transporter permease [Deltaproteobacteria bacterium]
MGRLPEDLRFALRLLAKHKSTTLAAVLTLALGIGATTAIFSVVTSVLFRPMPWPQEEQLGVLWQSTEQNSQVSVNRVDFADWQEQAKLFPHMALFRGVSLNLTGDGDPERLRGLETTSGIFPTLGIQPALGRGFSAVEDGPGAERVAILSHGLWQRQFGGSPSAVGQNIRLNGEPFTIIGILPAAIEGERLYWYGIGDVWVPFGLSLPTLPDRRGYSNGHLALARLGAETPVETGRQELKAIARRQALDFPETNAGKEIVFSQLRDSEVGDLQPALLTALGAIAFVLLIACANVANLQLTRAAARSREISVRTALGASRRRLLRQLLTESLVLALLGGVLGTLGAVWGVKWMAATLPADGAIGPGDIALDGDALLFALAVSLFTGLLFGLLPALHACRSSLVQGLTSGGGRGSSGGTQRRLASQLLVVGEVALALVLLIGAALMIRSFTTLRNVDPGFDVSAESGGVLVLRVPLPDSPYGEEGRWQSFYQQLIEKSAALPGVRSTAVSTLLPLVSGSSETVVLAEGQPLPQGPDDALSTLHQTVSPDYFRTLGIELLQGRLFSQQDHADSVPVAVIDEKMARSLWPGENPLGKRLAFEFERMDFTDPGPMYREVIGVVRHVRHYRLDSESRVEAYAPLAQPNRNITGAPSLWFVARTLEDPLSLAPAMRQLVRSLDADQPIYAVQSLESSVATHWARGKMISQVLGAFSTVALLLAAIGLYGVIAYSVAQRTHEIGIRMALGAGRDRVLQLILRQGLSLAVVGIGVGVVSALAVTGLLTEQLFGVAARDPSLFIGLSCFLLLIAALAAAVPAWRATRVEPVTALRSE